MDAAIQQALAQSAPLTVGLGAIGPGIGIGIMASGYFNASARQPEIQKVLLPYFFISLAFIELLALFALVSYFMLTMAQ